MTSSVYPVILAAPSKHFLNLNTKEPPIQISYLKPELLFPNAVHFKDVGGVPFENLMKGPSASEPASTPGPHLRVARQHGRAGRACVNVRKRSLFYPSLRVVAETAVFAGVSLYGLRARESRVLRQRVNRTVAGKPRVNVMQVGVPGHRPAGSPTEPEAEWQWGGQPTGIGFSHLFLDPNEDTEWNEILRDFGILPPKEEPKDEIEEMVLRLQEEAMVKPYEKMTLAQLKEAEDEFDDEDMRAIETYREKRLQEWRALKKKQKYGELREISGNQYVNEVTNADKDVWVIIHLYRSSIPMCLLVNQHLSLLARKFPETKFVKAIVNSCIQHYHDTCLPTIFVYKNGQIEGKFIGIIECGGINLKLEELEWKLAAVGAIQTDLEENPKKDIVDVMISSIRNTSIYDDTNSSNSDDDPNRGK
ncbi:LOW QUALITY PROTEIN: phosducin-like protein 2 [Pteronotus mesoamericanus]|uniref:LOW QUALITY PROTEIN: phosducin-like protein 2 n=1 Tax=Pteronotus mesoamericanus TaxID=1884717 RepID=UPI0023EB4F4D|nr:LOW QUALITY PROTEIN: phosducin-like protein 2 [Pteronotus parnellii mesoamericanus]